MLRILFSLFLLLTKLRVHERKNMDMARAQLEANFRDIVDSSFMVKKVSLTDDKWSATYVKCSGLGQTPAFSNLLAGATTLQDALDALKTLPGLKSVGEVCEAKLKLYS